jgi:hypothetical protein
MRFKEWEGVDKINSRNSLKFNLVEAIREKEWLNALIKA